jgi:hypothetical protein
MEEIMIHTTRNKPFYWGMKSVSILVLMALSQIQPTYAFPPQPWQAEITTPCATFEDVIDSCYINADRGYNGFGKVYAKLYTPNANDIPELDKLAVVVNGFDPQGLIDFNSLWGLIADGNVRDDLRNQGYSILLLNYGTHSVDYVQNNANALIKALELLDSGRTSEQKMPLIGISSGGVIARYALSYLESNYIPHNVGLFISFDSPHQGANIPLGIQHVASEMEDAFNDASNWGDDLSSLLTGLGFFGGIYTLFNAELISRYYIDPQTGLASDYAREAALISREFFDSPFANQMLINHKSGHSALRDNLFQELESYGDYPRLTRNVAITNGSVTGTTNGLQGHNLLLSYRGKDSDDQKFYMDLWTTVSGQNNIYFKLVVGWKKEDVDPIGTDLSDHHTAADLTYQTPNITTGIDAAPGGTIDAVNILTELIGDQVEGQFGGHFVATNSNRPHNFIPTVSALDIKQGDYFTNYLSASGGGQYLSDLTPFDAVYFAENGRRNTRHLDIDGKIAEAIISEIQLVNSSWLVPIIGSTFMQ